MHSIGQDDRPAESLSRQMLIFDGTLSVNQPLFWALRCYMRIKIYRFDITFDYMF